jgi:hypothetical protein
MPAPRKPRKLAKNNPQPFLNTLAPVYAQPVLINPFPRARLNLKNVAAIAISAGAIGIGIGYTIIPHNLPTVDAIPGTVVTAANSQYDRITVGDVIAATPSEAVQVANITQALQPDSLGNSVQHGVDLDRLQNNLSAYGLQGSVNGPAIR